jgi:hypothetical protein
MNVMDKVNALLGISPSDLIKRITIALVSVIIVLVLDVLILLGQSLGVVKSIPFLNEQVISTIIISSLLFSLSLIYYVLFSGKHGKEEAYSGNE